MPQFFIFLLLILALVGCGQKKVVVSNEPTPIKKKSSSSIVAEKSSSSEEKVEESKLEEEKPFTDSRDGKKYKMVKIGSQTWMAKNLNYNANGSKCYENKPANCDKYGRLYDWATAMKACPKGWHLPSNEDWDKLYRFVDNTNGTDSPYISETAGKFLKTVSGWKDEKGKPGNGEDKYGFSALPGGFCDHDSRFNFAGCWAVWWSASEYDHDLYAYNQHLICTDKVAYWSYNDKYYLFSVRCVKND